MTSAQPGTNISEVKVTNVSKHGFWLLIHDQEVFVPFEEFPWFKEAAIGKLLNVELPSPHHLYWPELVPLLRNSYTPQAVKGLPA
jgi:hypothetical protein